MIFMYILLNNAVFSKKCNDIFVFNKILVNIIFVLFLLIFISEESKKRSAYRNASLNEKVPPGCA